MLSHSRPFNPSTSSIYSPHKSTSPSGGPLYRSIHATCPRCSHWYNKHPIPWGATESFAVTCPNCEYKLFRVASIGSTSTHESCMSRETEDIRNGSERSAASSFDDSLRVLANSSVQLAAPAVSPSLENYSTTIERQRSSDTFSGSNSKRRATEGHRDAELTNHLTPFTSFPSKSEHTRPSLSLGTHVRAKSDTLATPSTAYLSPLASPDESRRPTSKATSKTSGLVRKISDAFKRKTSRFRLSASGQLPFRKSVSKARSETDVQAQIVRSTTSENISKSRSMPRSTGLHLPLQLSPQQQPAAKESQADKDKRRRQYRKSRTEAALRKAQLEKPMCSCPCGETCECPPQIRTHQEPGFSDGQVLANVTMQGLGTLRGVFDCDPLLQELNRMEHLPGPEELRRLSVLSSAQSSLRSDRSGLSDASSGHASEDSSASRSLPSSTGATASTRSSVQGPTRRGVPAPRLNTSNLRVNDRNEDGDVTPTQRSVSHQDLPRPSLQRRGASF